MGEERTYRLAPMTVSRGVSRARNRHPELTDQDLRKALVRARELHIPVSRYINTLLRERRKKTHAK